MDTLYIVMPAYNEEANIEAVVEQWYPVLEGKSEDSRLVIADAGSSDRTHEILKELRERHPKLEILSDTDRYHGPKLMALYDYAIQNTADYIFQTDSDGSSPPGRTKAWYASGWKPEGATRSASSSPPAVFPSSGTENTAPGTTARRRCSSPACSPFPRCWERAW